MKALLRRGRGAAVALVALGVAWAAQGQTPPPGRWRCYQPPAYTVLAWFDLTAETISVNGNEPLPVRFDADRIALPPTALPPYREGVHFSPGSTQGDAERQTLVLLRVPGQRPAAHLPRCYMTTH